MLLGAHVLPPVSSMAEAFHTISVAPYIPGLMTNTAQVSIILALLLTLP